MKYSVKALMRFYFALALAFLTQSHWWPATHEISFKLARTVFVCGFAALSFYVYFRLRDEQLARRVDAAG